MADPNLIDDALDAEQGDSVPAIDSQYAAAILILLLEDGDASSVVQSLTPGEIQRLGHAMFDAAGASEPQIDAALERFIRAAKQLPTLAPGARPHIEGILTSAIGSAKAGALIEAAAPRDDGGSIEALKWMDAADIATILADEHPQVGAVILASLDPEMAAQALGELPEALQTDLVFRAARLGAVSREAIAGLEVALARRGQDTKRGNKLSIGGKSDAARIMNKLKKGDGARILKEVKKRNKVMGQQIEDEMFVFENLMEVDDKGLGAIMRSVDSAVLSLALKGATAALGDRILACMSSRAAQTIRDEMEERGMVKRAEVEDAQKAIIAVARQLAEDGSIMIGGGSDDYV